MTKLAIYKRIGLASVLAASAGQAIAQDLPGFAPVSAEDAVQVDPAGPGAGAIVSVPGAGAIETEPGETQQSGNDFYCKERRLGTWFYCDRTKPKRINAAPTEHTSSARQLASIARALDELKARAILEPSEANVTAYIRYQREQLDRASTFADQWQRVIWQNPDIDYTLQRPVSTLGKRAWVDNRREEEDAAMRQLSQRYGIFYFYAQSCGACDVFAPILKSLADQSGFNVVAVSMDGGPNKTFPSYVVDAGQWQHMGLTSKATPALVLFDTVTRRPVPIGTGIMAIDEIKDRIFTLTRTRVGSDF
jgi:conjugal transfer pilus assembly protein TraF